MTRGPDGDYAEFLQWLRNPPQTTEAERQQQCSQTCPHCGEPRAYTVHSADCWSCHGDTSRPCMCCYGGHCWECGGLPGKPYSDDVPPQFKLAVARALGMMTFDEALWELDTRGRREAGADD